MTELNSVLEVSLKNLSNLSKEISSLNNQSVLSNAEKAGLIKFFELAFELSWKTLKRVLWLRNSIEVTSGTRDIFRQAAKQGYIDNPEQWFRFIETRNETVHVYDQKNIDTVVYEIEEFLSILDALINKLKEIKQ